MANAVEMIGISRRFGAVSALENVDLKVRAGSIHALVGENGAGKTTMMRILYGADRADSGETRVDGSRLAIRSAAEGIAHGIGMVSQHYAIIPSLSCLENLMLGAEPGWLIPFDEARDRAQNLADRMGFQFDWSQPASELSPAGAQKLEILKLLWRNARIMILDEPTAMLSPADSDALFDSLHALAKDGATVIVVTHRLPEVLEHCEELTVLRGGRLIESRLVAGTSTEELAELIVGRSVSMKSKTENASRNAVLLEVSGLSALGYRGDQAVKSINFTLKSGEMLGIAGVDGSGQRELFQAIAGVLRANAGSIRFMGSDWTKSSTADRILAGLRMIPEDRHDEGIVEDWSLMENAVVGLQRCPEIQKKGWMNPSNTREQALAMADRFSTKRASIDAPMASLSGGNQQRFVAARALSLEPKLILAFQPARGLDIEATRAVYEGIAESCKNGASALIVSFDLDELIDHCNRVMAMNRGRVFQPPPGLEKDRKTVGELMVASA